MKYRWKADRWCVSELVQGVLRAQVKALDREPWILRLIAPRPEDLHMAFTSLSPLLRMRVKGEDKRWRLRVVACCSGEERRSVHSPPCATRECLRCERARHFECLPHGLRAPSQPNPSTHT